MNTPAYWTQADQAELELLCHELAKAAFLHREKCPACQERLSCGAMREAIDAVIDWRDGRLLRSRAAYLRTGQELDDFRRRIKRVG